MQMKIEIRRATMPDDHQPRPDSVDEGFWPSRDPNAGGYVGEDCTDEKFKAQLLYAEKRMEAFNRGDWYFIGVRAEAEITIPTEQGGHSIITRISSPGIWGIESDSDESYINETFQEEVETLKSMIACMQKATPAYTVHDPAIETA